MFQLFASITCPKCLTYTILHIRNSPPLCLPGSSFSEDWWEGSGGGGECANLKEQIYIVSLFSPPPNLPHQRGGIIV